MISTSLPTLGKSGFGGGILKVNCYLSDFFQFEEEINLAGLDLADKEVTELCLQNDFTGDSSVTCQET